MASKRKSKTAFQQRLKADIEDKKRAIAMWNSYLDRPELSQDATNGARSSLVRLKRELETLKSQLR
jgi:hypothetical protein